MKAWKKGAVIGGIGGMVSIWLMRVITTMWGRFPNIYQKILIFPATLSIWMNSGFEVDHPYALWKGGTANLAILSVLIGALIGSIIGLAIEKYNQRSANHAV